MTRRGRTVALVAAVLVAVLTPGCSRRPDRVVLGIGLTSNAHPAVRLATSEINAQGGIDGVPIELVGMEWPGIESRFNPETVIKWADRFAATPNLLAVIGHSDSASTLSAASTYNRHGIPQIVTIATNPAITNIGEWTYRLCLSDAAQGPALASYAVRDWKKKRIAIFYVNDDYGRGLSQRFEVRARELGATILTAVTHRNTLLDDDRTMIRSTLQGLAARPEPPDLIVLLQRNQAADWTVKAIREAGLEADLLGGDNLAQSEFVIGNRVLLEGFRVSQFFNAAPGDERVRAFSAALEANGGVPNYAAAFAYDAVYLFRDAVKAGGFTRAGIKAYLDGLIERQTVVDGVGGSFTLGADHDARRALYIAEARSGALHLLQPITLR